MNADPFDTRKQAIEAAMLSNAEDKAQVAAFGKVAYEAYAIECLDVGLKPYKWDGLSSDGQCRWVRISQAVLDEARRCGWI